MDNLYGYEKYGALGVQRASVSVRAAGGVRLTVVTSVVVLPGENPTERRNRDTAGPKKAERLIVRTRIAVG